MICPYPSSAPAYSLSRTPRTSRPFEAFGLCSLFRNKPAQLLPDTPLDARVLAIRASAGITANIFWAFIDNNVLAKPQGGHMGDVLKTAVRSYFLDRLSTSQKVHLSKIRHGEGTVQQKLIGAVRRAASSTAAPQKTVFREYDARQAAQANLETILELLTAESIAHVLLPSPDVFDRILVISRSSEVAITNALARLEQREGWLIRRSLVTKSRDSGDSKRGLDVAALGAERRVVAPNGRLLSTRRESIRIEIWETLCEGTPRVDGGLHIAGTLHAARRHKVGSVTYITPAQWADAQERFPHELLPDATLLSEVTEPIDLVYTWVDGDDPLWQERKERSLGYWDPSTVHQSAAGASRYTSRDELKYSLRSVEMYANWFRHIYIVTDGQVPTWLDRGNPRITVIDHKEIFTDPTALPVFNSHAIESQLHHIPGLSERYIYMNDDVFFARPTGPELFFTSNGLSKFFPSKATLDVDPPSVRDMPVLSAAKHNRDFLLNRHGRLVTNKFKHTPHPQIRTVLEQLETEEPEMFRNVAASRVRHPDDVSIASALHHFHAYSLGRAVEGRIRYAYVDIGRDDAELILLRLSRRTDLDVLCLNETDSEPEQAEWQERLMTDFLDGTYPVPSSFELQMKAEHA